MFVELPEELFAGLEALAEKNVRTIKGELIMALRGHLERSQDAKPNKKKEG
jgi:hypothetical protein